MSILKYFSKKYRKQLEYNKKFKLRNKKTKIKVSYEIPLEIIKAGKYSYGSPQILYFGTNNEKLEIGNYVSIAKNVTFILGGNHNINTFTTYPFKVMCFGERAEAWGKGSIKVCDDVWIGYGSTILSGVNIGQGAIIAANSIVVKDVEPYSIVAGNPAKLIKYRFSNELIEEMKNIDFSKIEPEDLKDIQELIYKKLDFITLKEIKNKLK